MRILIADDSAVMRIMLEQHLEKDSDITLMPSVSNGRKAVDRARLDKPDLVILDDDMPEMTGIEAANILNDELGVPVLLYSENENVKNSCPFATFIKKPDLSSMSSDFFNEFDKKVKHAAAKVVFSRNMGKTKEESHTSHASKLGFAVLCIGASTGGPTAVQSVLSGLGKNFPLPIIYTQHLDVGDDKGMAAWFESCLPNLKFSIAKDGEEALPGHVYMAPANLHLVIDFINNHDRCVLKLNDDAPVRFLKPAVDKTFFSAAQTYKDRCLAILLTGMGSDGAEGCKEIVGHGGCTIVEDESTCAVFGMPKAAIEAGGATFVLPRGDIAHKVLSLV